MIHSAPQAPALLLFGLSGLAEPLVDKGEGGTFINFDTA